jgi:hypothetical protein
VRFVPKACGYLVCVFAVLLAAQKTAAQGHVTGLLGSPGATATFDGKQLPPQPPGFGGVINDWSFANTAEVDVPEGGGDGMIVAEMTNAVCSRDHYERL